MKTLEDFLFNLAVCPKLTAAFTSKPKEAMMEFGLEEKEANLVSNANKDELSEKIGSAGSCLQMIFVMQR